MRPRVIPAEDIHPPQRALPSHSGFNEAAGNPRGRPPRSGWTPDNHPGFNEAAGNPRGRRRGAVQIRRPVARGFNEAAGNPRGRPSHFTSNQLGFNCFNEAAGNPRGRRPPDAPGSPPAQRFNEAAGNPRGRRRRISSHPHQRPSASMRPRVIPAEDQPGDRFHRVRPG